MFCFANYRKVKDKFPTSDEDEYCFEPNFPDEFGYSELSAFLDLNIGLFEIDVFVDEIPQNFNIENVSEDFETILYSAKDYPPALAMMRLKLRKEIIKDKTDIELKAKNILKNFLENQKKSSFFLARSIKTDTIERRINSYQWIVGYTKSNEQINVKWICWDYHIYESPIEHFDISLDELERRFR